MDWKNTYCKNAHATQIIYKFSAIPIKLPMSFFNRTRRRSTTKTCVEPKGPKQSEVKGTKRKYHII